MATYTVPGDFATLALAAAGVPAGANTIVVSAGTYSETLTDSRSGTTGNYDRYWLASGTVYINGMSLTGNNLKVEGFTMSGKSVPAWYGLIYMNGNYIHLKNCTVTNTNMNGYTKIVLMYHSDTNTDPYPQYNIIEGCTFNTATGTNIPVIHMRGSHNSAIDNEFLNFTGMDCFYIIGDSHRIAGNYAHDFTHNHQHIDFVQVYGTVSEDSFTNFIIEDNFVYWTDAPTLADDSTCFVMLGVGAANGIIRNNISYAVQGVSINGGDNHDIEIYNNTFISNLSWSPYGTSRGVGVAAKDGPAVYNVWVYNNVFVDIWELHILFTGTNLNADYNLHYDSDAGTPGTSGGTWPKTHDVWMQSPLLSNIGGSSATDYKLTASSPAIDAGVNLYSEGVVDDYDGVARPSGVAPFEIGAYEHVSGATPVTIPSPGSIYITL